jgi:uncharacterized protein (TIGR00730 family)
MSSVQSPRRLCVFAGAHVGHADEYQRTAADLGRTLVRRGYELVYGGGSVGLMGTIANAVLGEGGTAIGVIPEALARRELAHHRLTRLEVVGTMHERKRRMAELSDGFIALPGGLGTLEELFEAVTLTQLGYQHKPVGLLNCMDYYARLLEFVDHIVGEGLVTEANARLLIVDEDGERLLTRLESWSRATQPSP